VGQPIAAGNVGRELGARAQPKRKVASHNMFVSAHSQHKITRVDDDGAIASWTIDGLDYPALVTSGLLIMGHEGSMPWMPLQDMLTALQALPRDAELLVFEAG
jgi:hypothetical protein